MKQSVWNAGGSLPVGKTGGKSEGDRPGYQALVQHRGPGKLWGRGLRCGGVGASLPWHDQPQAVLGQGGRERAARAAEDRETECFLWMQ